MRVGDRQRTMAKILILESSASLLLGGGAPITHPREKGPPVFFTSPWVIAGLFLKPRHLVTLSKRCQPPKKKTPEKGASPQPGTAGSISRPLEVRGIGKFFYTHQLL